MTKALPTSKRALIFSAMAMGMMALSACVSIKEVHGPYKVGQGTYQLNRSWNDVSQVTMQTKGVHLLTLDGPVLNSLYLSQGLAAGDYLVRPERRRENTTPSWRADMGILEQIEFVTESIEAFGYNRVVSAQPRPVEVGGIRGVRFELSAETDAGLEIKGFGQMVVRDKLAYVAIYMAPNEHYFAQSQAEATAALDSLTF